MIESLLNPPLAHFILRVVLGVLIVAHGYPKLFKGFSGFAGWLDSIGLRPGKFWALVAGAVEFLGGIFLILGLWVQVVAILFAIQMLVAMWKVKWGKVGLTAQGGWELDLIYLAVAIALALMGPGYYVIF
ncbi:MAG: DoxX family protein [Candidatus Sungiibacteriota bacterium]|uniref:DoxX family protein n=1 Tax=Candidatus Sungiibacteriota bacterium TaxID=2750080 RepID=A0A7T5UQY7_9BACT|nr:MAG: DoxX family protein [Candidatus Sungbacteria bacterium]